MLAFRAPVPPARRATGRATVSSLQRVPCGDRHHHARANWRIPNRSPPGVARPASSRSPCPTPARPPSRHGRGRRVRQIAPSMSPFRNIGSEHLLRPCRTRRARLPRAAQGTVRAEGVESSSLPPPRCTATPISGSALVRQRLGTEQPAAPAGSAPATPSRGAEHVGARRCPRHVSAISRVSSESDASVAVARTLVQIRRDQSDRPRHQLPPGAATGESSRRTGRTDGRATPAQRDRRLTDP